MTNISVQALGCVVPPEKTALAREAYFRAISRLGYDDSDFADVAPERLDARLARLVIRFAVQGSEEHSLFELRYRAENLSDQHRGRRLVDERGGESAAIRLMPASRRLR